jgi:hypothetical protein
MKRLRARFAIFGRSWIIFFLSKPDAGRHGSEDQSLIYANVAGLSVFDTISVRNYFKIRVLGITFVAESHKKKKGSMKAIILKDFGGIDQFQEVDLPVPGISEGEVLVEVKAISINPVDVKTRKGSGVAGRFKGTNPMILGWDMSGIVKESKSPLFEAGDEVFGMIDFPGQGKVYAEYVAAPADQLAEKPAGVSFPAAAATTLAALTAWQAFADHSKLRAGQRVLIHAAAGGVGHFCRADRQDGRLLCDRHGFGREQRICVGAWRRCAYRLQGGCF